MDSYRTVNGHRCDHLVYVYGLNVVESFVKVINIRCRCSAGSGFVRMSMVLKASSFLENSVGIVIGCEKATLRIFATSISIVCACPASSLSPSFPLFITTNPTRRRRSRPQQAQWIILSCHRDQVRLVTETGTGTTLTQKTPSSTFPTFLARAQDLRG